MCSETSDDNNNTNKKKGKSKKKKRKKNKKRKKKKRTNLLDFENMVAGDTTEDDENAAPSIFTPTILDRRAGISYDYFSNASPKTYKRRMKRQIQRAKEEAKLRLMRGSGRFDTAAMDSSIPMAERATDPVEQPKIQKYFVGISSVVINPAFIELSEKVLHTPEKERKKRLKH